MDGLRERVAPLWKFESLLWGISSGFPLTNYLALPGSESVFGILQGPPLCACAFLSQDGFQQRGLWVVDITYYGVAPPPFLTSREPFCTCVVREVSLISRMGIMWSFISYLGRAQPPLSIVLLLIFWSFCPNSKKEQTPVAYPGAHLSPAMKITIKNKN